MKFKKLICVILSCVMTSILFAGCKDGADETLKIKVPDLSRDYVYQKQNNDSLMQFYSSDESLDSFINEYMERHLRYSDNAVDDLKIGESKGVWKEWEAMSVIWMNTAGIGYSPKESIGNWFSNIVQDDFGYIWVDNGSDPATSWGQSWQFPNMAHSGNANSKEYYNTSYFNGLNNIGGAHNGSNELTALWTGVSNTGINGCLKKNTTDYYDYMVINGSDMRSVTFTYETPQSSKDAAEEEAQSYAKPYMATPFCSPFLEIDLSLTDFDSLGKTNQVEDIYIYWKGGSGIKNTSWDNEHMVKYSEFSSNYDPFFASSKHIVFPMYAHRNWGKSAGLDDAVTDMKIIIQFKNGINAEVKLEEVTFAFDGRQVNNNSVYLAAAAYYFMYTQDTAWLEKNLDKLRKTMQFLLTYCRGQIQELITVEEFVGHDGSSNYDYYAWKDENGFAGNYTNTGTGSGIGDGYWDCLSYPAVSLYCNIYYYKALKAMLYLEDMARAAEVSSQNTVVVKTADMSGLSQYSETVETLKSKEAAFKTKFQDYFWNEETGRFHLGYLSASDKGVTAGVLDEIVDYGFTTFNEKAVELELATDEQAVSIMSWINGGRKVETDTADNSTAKKSIYLYEFAPRWTTKQNDYQYWFRFSGTSAAFKWDVQIQNGGTAVHCAYYDLAAENAVNGPDASFAKLKNIQAWYEKVKAAGGTGTNFYRTFYTKRGIILQGGNSSGVLGLDKEFIEAAIVPAAIPVIFFGLGSTEYKTLNVTPNLPPALSFWKMENLMFAAIEYDLSIGPDFVQLNNVGSGAEGYYVSVTLDAPESEFTVRQHDRVLTKDTDYSVSGGKVIIKAPFTNGRIQIVKS